MKQSIKTTGAISLLSAALVVGPVYAADNSGWYGGLGLGQSHAKIDDERISAGLADAGIAVTSFDDEEKDFAYKVFGGYKFNRYFALEGGYFNLGEFGFNANTSPAGTLNGNIEVDGFNIDAVGIMPLSQKFSSFARVGAQRAEAQDTFSGTGAVAVTNGNLSKTDTNYKAGVGLQYDFTKRVGMRGEWERYRINDGLNNKGDIDMLSVGLVVKFGGEKSERAPDPAPKAAAPSKKPAPALVIVPVKRTQRYCGILDIQFEIDNDDIQREEKEKLAVLGAFMKKYPDATAVIEGHTDNVGTTEHKQRLSQQRADNVVRYLADDLKIDSDRLQAHGYGDTRPVSENASEDGKRLNRRINAVIACVTDVEGIKVAAARVTMAVLVEFDAHKAEVKPEYRDELQKVAKFLNANPTLTAHVQGHTGNLQNAPESAMEISQRRAQKVVDYLANEFGVERSRLTAEGFGQTRRFAYNTSLEGQQENRRVNVVIDYPR